MTADTYSATLGYLIMGTGNDNNIWGSNANAAVFQTFEDAIANSLTSGVTGGTLDLSGSPPPAAASQARYAALIFSGTLTSNQIVQVPNLQKWWWVINSTGGSFTLSMKTPSGSPVVIPGTGLINSGWQQVYCDGANNIVVMPFNSLHILMPDGSASFPPYSNVNETNSGWRRAGTQDWRLTINGLDVLQVTGAGASSPSIVNILSPNSLQLAGAQVIPAGTEISGAFIALPSGGWLWEDGTAYSRSTYANLFGAITATLTGNTHTSTTVDNLSSDLTSYGMVGAYVEGTGIPTGTTIVSIAATSMVLSAAATGTASGVSLRILPWGQGDASTTFNIPDRRERTLFGRGNMNGTSSPGRITAYDATKLGNTAFGAESFTLAQSALPNYAPTVTTTVAAPTITTTVAAPTITVSTPTITVNAPTITVNAPTITVNTPTITTTVNAPTITTTVNAPTITVNAPTITITDPGHTHDIVGGTDIAGSTRNTRAASLTNGTVTTNTATTGITATSIAPTASSSAPTASSTSSAPTATSTCGSITATSSAPTATSSAPTASSSTPTATASAPTATSTSTAPSATSTASSINGGVSQTATKVINPGGVCNYCIKT